MRDEVLCPAGALPELPSRLDRKNISLFKNSDFQYVARHPASMQRGDRERHEREAGMRWTREC
jgi:hypothetical protein